MKQIKKNTTLFICLLFLAGVYSPKTYASALPSKEVRNNYFKYKKFSPEKKARMRNKWKSFKSDNNWDNLSPKEQRRLKNKVLKRQR